MSWKMVVLDKVIQLVPNKALGDDEIRVQLAEGSVDSPSINKDIKELTFALDASAKASVEAFNSPGDTDAMGVVGDKSTGNDEKDLAPVLLFDKQHGWLKYSAEARVKASGSFKLPFAALDASGEARVTIADYRVHKLTDNVHDALRADATGPLRLPMNRNNLNRLGPLDALAFQARGTLKTSVTLQWSDVFTTNLQLLNGLVPANTLLGLNIELGASLTAGVEVVDDYLVVLSRPESGRIRIALKKAVARQASVAARAGVSVGALDPKQVSAQAMTVLQALLGGPIDTFEKLLTQFETSSLAPAGLAAFRFALERLGLEDKESNPESLRQAWLDLKQKLPARIEELAKQKLELGFAYEYSRISEQTTLLSLTCGDAQAAALHGDLLLGRLDAVGQYLKDEGIAPEKYLLEDLTTSTQAWGFSLKLGKWGIGGKDTRVLKEVVQRNSLEDNGPRRLSFLGTRSYKGDLLKPFSAWTVDFKADMAEFQVQPTVADLDYGLYMLIHGPEKKRSLRDLRQVLDEAIIWRVMDDADEEQVLRQLHEAAGLQVGEKLNESVDVRAETRLELKLGDSTFRELLERATGPDVHKAFARALARALPWYPVPCREKPELRESIYAPLWEAFLAEGGWKVEDAARIAGHNLKGHALVGDFYKAEGAVGTGGKVGEGTVTFAEVIKKNEGTVLKWRELRAALLKLRNDIVARRSPDVVKEVFKGMEASWGQSFHLLATGAFFLELAMRGTKGLGGVERTFTVTLTDTQRQLVFSKTR